jgi:hypothetical protein
MWKMALMALRKASSINDQYDYKQDCPDNFYPILTTFIYGMYEKIQFTALGKVGFNMDQYA